MKILEVTNVDLQGKRFNGYDLIEDFKLNHNIDIKQIVIHKESFEKKVIELLPNHFLIKFFYYAKRFENEVLSVHNVFSITTPALFASKEYKEADIIHLHMLHNSNLSLYTLEKIAREKKVIYSFHDPWPITGRCVHFYDCKLWMDGCDKCDYLNTAFPLKDDNCNALWKYKKRVFSNPNINVVYTTEWMQENINLSPIMKNVKKHFIPLGINTNEFKEIDKNKARKHFNIDKDDIVLFFRTQKEFKGTNYIIDALKKLNLNKNITLLTCSEKGLLFELENKYNIIDLGQIKDEDLINAYNACDIFLMPSTGESFGYMAIEAMACSKPVVVFNNTAMPMATNAPQIGVLVNNLDSDDLANKIEWLINDQKERISRGIKGRKFVEEKYDYDLYLNKIEKLYIDVFNEKKEIFEDINILDNQENINNLKCILNIFTKKYFKKSSLIYKKLIFKTDRFTNNKIEYHTNESLSIVDEYTKLLYKNLINNPTKSIRVKYLVRDFLNNNKELYKRHGILFVFKNIIRKFKVK